MAKLHPWLQVCKIVVLSGVQHSDDGKLMFRIVGTPEKLHEEDERAKDLLIDFIYDFASTG